MPVWYLSDKTYAFMQAVVNPVIYDLYYKLFMFCILAGRSHWRPYNEWWGALDGRRAKSAGLWKPHAQDWPRKRFPYSFPSCACTYTIVAELFVSEKQNM